MGQKMTISKYRPPAGEEITRNRFEFQYIIGKGGFGKVWRVIDKKTKSSYALKEMQKVKVIDKRSEKSIKYERELLTRLKNPFIVNMYYSFQDADNLYLVMDLLTGGDLRYHVSRYRRFTEEQTRFFIACIVMGFEYIHSKNVIHRDIKPENLVLDDKGYVRITDFGIAKLFSGRNGNETSGTPGYMSPEVMKGTDHTSAVDYFALGVIGYEFMLGRRPYVGKSRKEIKEQMMSKPAQIKLNDMPDCWSEESADFFNKLLQRKPEARLGFKGATEVKSHPWLKYYPWEKLKDKKIESPFVPEKKDNYDKKYCESVDKIGIETKGRYDEYINYSNFNCIFQNFTYYGIVEKSPVSATPTKAPLKRCISQGPSSPMFNTNPKNISRMNSITPKKTQSNIKVTNRSYTNIAILMKNESRNKYSKISSIKSTNLRNSPLLRRSYNLNQSKQKMISRENTPINQSNGFCASITSPINYSKKYINNKKTKTIEGGYLNQKLLISQTRSSSLIKHIRKSNNTIRKDNKTFHLDNNNYGSLLSRVPFASQTKKCFNISGDDLTCYSNKIKLIDNQHSMVVKSPNINNTSNKKNLLNSSRKCAHSPNSHNSLITPLTSSKLRQTSSMNNFFKNNKINSNSSNSTSSSASTQKIRPVK